VATATEPTRPETRAPMVKRSKEELVETVIFKNWQAATAEGGMKDMIKKEALQGAEKAKGVLIDRDGFTQEEADALWVDWARSHNPDLLTESVKSAISG
jgi:hypothetical protein